MVSVQRRAAQRLCDLPICGFSGTGAGRQWCPAGRRSRPRLDDTAVVRAGRGSRPMPWKPSICVLKCDGDRPWRWARRAIVIQRWCWAAAASNTMRPARTGERKSDGQGGGRVGGWAPAGAGPLLPVPGGVGHSACRRQRPSGVGGQVYPGRRGPGRRGEYVAGRRRRPHVRCRAARRCAGCRPGSTTSTGYGWSKCALMGRARRPRPFLQATCSCRQIERLRQRGCLRARRIRSMLLCCFGGADGAAVV